MEVSNKDYSKLVKRSKAARTRDLQRLVELKLIEMKAKGKATYYVLKEK